MTDKDQDNKVEADNSSAKRAQAATQDLLKLLITMSTAVLALSATFVTRFQAGPGYLLLVLLVGWVFLGSSIYYGISGLTTVARCINNDTREWWKQSIRPTRKSWKCFLIGIVLLACFAATVFVARAMDGVQADDNSDTLNESNVPAMDTTIMGNVQHTIDSSGVEKQGDTGRGHE